jgi:dTDP-4-dehydrorhamnose 3,5-epimerase
MDIIDTNLQGVKVITPKRFGDARGFFAEVYNRRHLAEHGIDLDFVQDNVSLSRSPGTLRGLHFQTPPFAQAKLVSVLHGAVLDVAVDLRRGSPTLGRHVAARLSAAAGNMLFVPVGFAHGFLTLEPDTLFTYKVSNYYAPEHDRGIRWDDPRLAIDWGIAPDQVTLSDKDRRLPAFNPAAPYFADDPSADGELSPGARHGAGQHASARS